MDLNQHEPAGPTPTYASRRDDIADVLLVAGGAVSIALAVAPDTRAETFDDFAVDERFDFAMYFWYDDAAPVRDYDSVVC